jgi:hypothetical protein
MDKIQLIITFRQMFNELNEIICQFDPYGLSKGGIIADEFEDEAWEILFGLTNTNNLTEVVLLVSDVFTKSFDTIDFNEKKCYFTAERIYEWWISK